MSAEFQARFVIRNAIAPSGGETRWRIWADIDFFGNLSYGYDVNNVAVGQPIYIFSSTPSGQTQRFIVDEILGYSPPIGDIDIMVAYDDVGPEPSGISGTGAITSVNLYRSLGLSISTIWTQANEEIQAYANHDDFRRLRESGYTITGQIDGTNVPDPSVLTDGTIFIVTKAGQSSSSSGSNNYQLNQIYQVQNGEWVLQEVNEGDTINVTDDLTLGTNEYNGDSIYIWDADATEWSLIGPGAEATGPTGPTGASTEWTNGPTGPTAGQGNDGDYYLDDSTGDVYNKSSGTWNFISNMEGPTGPSGSNGPTGPTGASTEWTNGSTGPTSGQGSTGDYYLDDSTGDVFSKATGSWTFISNMEGPTGPSGSNGPTGPTGLGIPTGGVTGDILTKDSSADFDVIWQAAPLNIVREVIDTTGGNHIWVLAATPNPTSGITVTRTVGLLTFSIPAGVQLFSTTMRLLANATTGDYDPASGFMQIDMGTGTMVNSTENDRWAPSYTGYEWNSGSPASIDATLSISADGGGNPQLLVVFGLPSGGGNNNELVKIYLSF